MRNWLGYAALFALPLTACGGDNNAPVLDPLVDQKALVNSVLQMTLRGSDADGDPLSFGFASQLPDITNRASIKKSGNDRALFRFTPFASDIGVNAFDFTLSDGEATTRETITITVELGGEGSTSPVFVQPLGTGATLDLEQQNCLEIPIVVEDPDSASVTLSQEEPIIAGATLDQTSELGGTWSFCPSKEQIAKEDRYPLTLAADDGENPKTRKNFLVVLRSENAKECPGEAPMITHTPEDVQSVVDLTISVKVSDDIGIKYEPLLYYSDTPPGDPPDIGDMLQVTMELLDGDKKSGTWGADVPNPVANTESGSSAQLYYVVAAKDNDDAEGTCDHLVQAPDKGSYAITVTNPGGSGGLGLCESCTADVQCGEAGDNCVYLDGGNHCFKACEGDAQCPDGYYCSFSEFTSVDNAKARQCIPNDYKCNNAPPGCVDDSHEDNDSLQEASAAAVLAPGNYNNLKSCPGDGNDDDEDWFQIDVSSDAKIDLSIMGGNSTDLDLSLTDANGTVVEKSDTLESNESLTACLTPGIYYIRVYSWSSAENSYSLNYQQTSESCSGPNCQDDSLEDDDNASQAQFADLNQGKFSVQTSAICSGDEDWFEVMMYDGETLYATLTFLQSNANEDLDLWMFDSDGMTNLSGCDEQMPGGCDPLNGQSGTSDEKLVWPINKTGTYYVVVHGWDGSENLYDICIGLTENDCP